MDVYTSVAYANAKQLTLRYSTSFGISSRFFASDIKPHIYAIYGLVRIADEIVDTYKGPDAPTLLDGLESQAYAAIESGYSTNPIVHAFALTAKTYGIDQSLIEPFFTSMRMDLDPHSYSSNDYKKYIYGSAEVVGLMCLRVFCDGDDKQYNDLKNGAVALGSAYQKVNFLRDLAADYQELGRLYFPGKTFDGFNEKDKREIIDDIQSDFDLALPSLRTLPANSRKATMISYVYYAELLKRLKETPVEIIKTSRIRVPSWRKLLLLVRTAPRRNQHV